MKKRVLALVLALGLVSGTLAGCKSGEPAAKGTDTNKTESTASGKDSIKIAVYSDFKTFDPMNSGMTLDAVVYRNIFDCLLNFYAGDYEKVLVDDYKVSDDGLSYNLKLKSGVKFHNGEELKASDVVFSMLRAKDSTTLANYTQSIDNVVADGDYEVTITLSEPYVPFIQAVLSGVPIMNEKAVNEAGDNVGTDPIGTGPYKFVKFDPGQQVVLEANDDWHLGKANIKNAVYVVITDPSSALMTIESGEIDMTYTIPSIAAQSVSENPKLKIEKYPTTGSGYICYNLEKAPFNDVNFRLAMAYAIDKQEIVDIAMDGMAEVADSLWTDLYEGYSGEYETPKYNVEKAKEYLEKSSYNGEKLYFRVGYDNYKKIAVVVQEQFRKIGLEIEVEQMEANAWVDDMKKGNFDISTIVMTYDLDMDYWANVFHSSAIGAYNFPRLNDAEIDAAFDNGKAILDSSRNTAYKSVEKAVNEDAVVIPIYFRVVPCVYDKDLSVSRAYPNGFSKIIDMKWN